MNHVQLKTRVVGVDVSSERTVFGIVDIRGNVIAKDSFPTFDCENVADFETRLCDSIVALIEANGGYETIRSVGVSSPSANFVTGCIENAANLPWKGVIPLAAMMQDRLGLAVGVANDAHATAMGEKVYGSAHGMNDFVVLNLAWDWAVASSLVDVPSLARMALPARWGIPVWCLTVVSAAVATRAVWRPMSTPRALSILPRK